MTEGNLYFMLMKIYVFLAVYKKVRLIGKTIPKKIV